MSTGTQGCCADKACTDKTCMNLPSGKTCGDCVHTRRCVLMFGHKPEDMAEHVPYLKARATPASTTGEAT